VISGGAVAISSGSDSVTSSSSAPAIAPVSCVVYEDANLPDHVGEACHG
jgi:predicted PP-loop superfamily ATPase